MTDYYINHPTVAQKIEELVNNEIKFEFNSSMSIDDIGASADDFDIWQELICIDTKNWPSHLDPAFDDNDETSWAEWSAPLVVRANKLYRKKCEKFKAIMKTTAEVLLS